MRLVSNTMRVRPHNASDAWLKLTHRPCSPCRLDEKIRKLDEQLIKHREAIKRSRPGPAQEAAKRRALNVCMIPDADTLHSNNAIDTRGQGMA